MRNRWSDNDRNFGPFTYARNRKYRPFTWVLRSGGDESGSYARLSLFGHTFLCTTPRWLVKPYSRKVKARYWDAETIERMGRDWYWEIQPREFGISYHEGYLSVSYGRQTMDSSTEQRWGCFLPWTQWRSVRLSLYGTTGEHYWTTTDQRDFQAQMDAQRVCPKEVLFFSDFDGKVLTASTWIEERESKFGTGYFKWLSWFRRSKIYRSLRIEFSGETGRRKGSWKGGTVGASIEMLPGELHQTAFQRYCLQNEMKLIQP